MKNSFMVENEEIEFRRATKNDNFIEIAELIYKTDEYIYPFWFDNNIENAKNILNDLIGTEGFIFNYNNLYIAYDKSTNHIVGILCGLDRTENFEYDYSELENINKTSNFTVKKYLKALITEAKENDFLYISNLCVDKEYRGKKIGTKLLGYFLTQMEKTGYDKFALDCLLHNLRAKNLYHSFGFKEMKEIVGFDGTNESKVEVVSMLRKKGDYLPKEFE